MRYGSYSLGDKFMLTFGKADVKERVWWVDGEIPKIQAEICGKDQ